MSCKACQPEDFEMDWEHAIQLPPNPNARAVVSVAFNRKQFERLDKMVQASGKKMSQFIRDCVFAEPPPAHISGSHRFRSYGPEQNYTSVL